MATVRPIWGGLGRMYGATPAKPLTPAMQDWLRKANPGKVVTSGGLAAPLRPAGGPPPGSYDPTLDANLGGAQRGYFDLGQDIATQNTRDTVDYGLGVADINRGAGRSMQDLTTNRDQATQDYQRNLGLLRQSYQRLAGTQGQQDNAAGVLLGGAALQAAAKRAANQATDQQPLDIGEQRMLQSFATQTGRVGEDQTNALGKLALQLAPPDANNPLGGRSWQDRTTQYTRAGRELTHFGLDTSAAKAFQAAGTGWNPPLPKKKKKKAAR